MIIKQIRKTKGQPLELSEDDYSSEYDDLEETLFEKWLNAPKGSEEERETSEALDRLDLQKQ